MAVQADLGKRVEPAELEDDAVVAVGLVLKATAVAPTGLADPLDGGLAVAEVGVLDAAAAKEIEVNATGYSGRNDLAFLRDEFPRAVEGDA
jgi:hypothetical protein